MQAMSHRITDYQKLSNHGVLQAERSGFSSIRFYLEGGSWELRRLSLYGGIDTHTRQSAPNDTARKP